MVVASDQAPEAPQKELSPRGQGLIDVDNRENNTPSPSPGMLEDNDTVTWVETKIRANSKLSTHSSSRLPTTPFTQSIIADISQNQPSQLQNCTNMSQQKYITQPNTVPELRRTVSTPNPLSSTTSKVNNHFPHQQPPPLRNNPNYNRPRPLNLVRSNSQTNGVQETLISPAHSAEYKPLMIGNSEEVTTFLETRFRQLQQLCCKIVAKAWIKVIEPKKQTRYPYNRGEESKPDWWPIDVRHKEPDHLMKPGIPLILTGTDMQNG